MEIKLIKVDRTKSKKPCSYPEAFMEKWPENVNAKFIFHSSDGQATLLHECEDLTKQGWPAGVGKQQSARRG